MAKVYVLNCAPYDFVTESGDKLTGAKVQYFGSSAEHSKKFMGVKIGKAPTSLDVANKAFANNWKFPGHYEVEFGHQIKADGSATVRIDDIKGPAQ